MKIKDAIYNAAVFLQLEDVIGFIENGGEKTDEVTELVSQLERLAKLVINEIVCDYCPIKTTEKIVVSGGYFDFSELEKDVLDVYSIKQNGKNISFKQSYSSVALDDGIYDIEYSYIINTGNIDSEVTFSSGRITGRVVGYGIAAEYAIISGLTDEAVLWDKRYKDALEFALAEHRNIKIKKRRWL